MNTGAEAVETGIKAARRWAYRKKGVKNDHAEIVVCSNNFHGRTTTIVGFSTDPDANDGYGPFTPGFKIIPFNDPAALEGAITENTAAFMVEPIQGEAGVIVPDKGYLKEIRRICTKNDVLLMLDEVQTGFCRTGKRFCWMHDDARPDIMQVGKALGGGVYPVSAIVADRDIMDVFTPGSHGSTFGGNPIASAVGLAALSVLEDEKLDERAAQNGEHFMEVLSRMPEKRIREVRGKGLLVGVEIQVSAGKARPYCLKLKEEGILAKDTHAQTIRFAPPLITERSVLEGAAETIRKVLVP
jgi:ornithine--oxo-acid transaminase